MFQKQISYFMDLYSGTERNSFSVMVVKVCMKFMELLKQMLNYKLEVKKLLWRGVHIVPW